MREGIVAAKAGGKVMDNIGNEGVSVNNDNNGIAVDGRILFHPRAWEREQVALGGGRENNSPPKHPENRNNAAHNTLLRNGYA